MTESKTVQVSSRVPADLLDRLQARFPAFNRSEAVVRAISIAADEEPFVHRHLEHALSQLEEMNTRLIALEKGRDVPLQTFGSDVRLEQTVRDLQLVKRFLREALVFEAEVPARGASQFKALRAARQSDFLDQTMQLRALMREVQVLKIGMAAVAVFLLILSAVICFN